MEITYSMVPKRNTDSEGDGTLTTVVIADDHPLVRRGTREILAQEESIAVVGEATDGTNLLELVETLRPMVAVVDIGMPELNGIDATKVIKERWPETSVVILSINDDDDYVLSAVEAGASGYLTKDVADAELIRAVLAAGQGRPTLVGIAANAVIKQIRSSSVAVPREELTAREVQILKVVAAGWSNRTIAEELDLSPRTVEVHLHRAFKKLGVTSRTAAVVEAARLGLIDLEAL